MKLHAPQRDPQTISELSVDLDKPDLDVARRLFTEGRLEEARHMAGLLLAEPNAPNGAREVLGRVALAQGRAEAAEAILVEATGKEPRNGSLWVALGAARLEIGDLDGAEQAFERSVRTALPPTVALAGLAEVSQRRGDLSRTADLLRQALAGAVTAPSGTKSLPDGGVLPPALADAVATLAEGRRRVGRLAEAERLHRVALAGHGACGPALVGLGALRAAGGHPTEAEELYRAALEQGASPVDAALALASLKDGERRSGVAAVLREAAALAAREEGDILAVAKALAHAGQHRSAIAQFTRVTRMMPSHTEARRALVASLVAEGELEDALSHLDRAAALAPTEAWPWRERGLLLAADDRPVRAIAAFRGSLERAPGDGETLKALARAQMAVEALDEALLACVASLAAQPLDGDLRTLFGELLAKRRYLDLVRLSGRPGAALGRARRVPDEVLAVLERTAVFRGLPWERAACEQLDGGNLGLGFLWRVRLGGADIMVRRPLEGEDASQGNDGYGDEGRNMRLAADLGVAPPLLAFHPADGAHVSLFAPGRPLTADAMHDRGALGRLAQALGRLHGSGARFAGRLDMGAVLARREHALAHVGPMGAVRDWDVLRAELPRVLRALAAKAPADVPLVNAQGPHGFIDGERQMLVTDWSTSAMGDPYRDLGVLANAGHLGEVPERVLLSLYLGRRAPPSAVARLRLHRFLDHYLCLLEALDAAASLDDPQPLLDLAEGAAMGCRERVHAEDWERTLASAAD